MTVTTTVPLVDLHLQHHQIRRQVAEGFERVLAAGSFILGPEAETFEAGFAAYCGVRHAMGVGNGTDALELVLRAAGIGPGDEVIVPANTFVATAEAAARVGACVVLADCDENYLLDPAEVDRVRTPRTRAVMAVHLYGQPASVELIREAAGEGVFLIEDAAQAQGARRHGRRAGGLADAAATSFYPGKNLGAYGDAGAVMTGRDDVAQAVRALRNHGGTRRYEHRRSGMNSRLDDLQAVVLNAKLALLDGWNAQRREAAALYDRLLADVEELTLPMVAAGNESVFHLYVVRTPHRDAVAAALQDAGIGAAIHYPLPVHLLPAFASLGHREGSFPLAERASREVLSLPIYPGITPEQQQYVADQLRFAQKAAADAG